MRFTTSKPVMQLLHQARPEMVDLTIVNAPEEPLRMSTFLDTAPHQVSDAGNQTILVVKTPLQRPYRRVLALVDFSQASRYALERAHQLTPHAEFHVLHVYEPPSIERLPSSSASKDSLIYYRRRKAEQVTRRLEAFLRANGDNSQRISRVIPHQQTSDAIIAAAVYLRADLVTIGADGGGESPSIRLGDVARRVLQGMSCDVLIAWPAAAQRELRQAARGLNGTPVSI